jgi:hypothetical protein
MHKSPLLLGENVYSKTACDYSLKLQFVFAIWMLFFRLNTMVRISLICLLSIVFYPSFSQLQKECKGNIDLNAVFEKVDFIPDTSATKKPVSKTPSGTYCPAGTRDQYRLRVSNDAFTVISFTITVETQEGDIAEMPNQGEYLQSGAFRMIATRKKNEPVYLSCIKVLHSSGTIRILKPITLTSVAL